MAALRDRARELLERWKEEIQRLPVPAHIKLVDGEAGENLERIAAAVLEMVEKEEAAVFQPGGEMYRLAGEMGRLRFRQGFSVEELVQEHVILRNEFWNLFHQSVDMKRVVDFQLEKKINASFDALLQAAAAAYHYESSREIMENPLRDPVTGLYNQSYFHGRMMEELRRAVRYKHEITLVICEVGNYHRLLEIQGKEAVEEALRYTASVIARMTRDCDVIARMGEASFAALLPETGWRGGKVMAERLCRYLEKEFPARTPGVECPELYWGLASFPDEVRQPEMLYTCAVEALRDARSLACGEVAVYRGAEHGGTP
ncbi:diguanylate cyclase [Candidatus Solincola tengchongensis]|uniref:diguanylate cyclase domain-containing protein n=1 Tax=Candidatus Solincola tengchongensis TaxID=2900693 RepID=UPI00257F48E3|nr:diguanylate cyclase [Candidatus Solincola tengchongensis]